MLVKFISYVVLLFAVTFEGSNSREQYDDIPPWLKHRLANVANIQDTLSQGVSWANDQQVFEETFNYPAQNFVQTILFRGNFPCKISHIRAQAFEGGRPILVYGGVGYRFFRLMFKSRAGKPMKGRARAYCRRRHRPTTVPATAEAEGGDYSD